MANKISTQAKEELVQVLKVQYRKSLKTEKSQILNQFIAVSGYHRKHAIRILNSNSDSNNSQNNSCKMIK